MEQEILSRLHKLSERVIDVTEMLAALAEKADQTLEEVKSCSEAIASVKAEYQAILDDVPRSEHVTIERRYGRKVMALRQQAAFLPKMSVGTPAKKPKSTEWIDAGHSATFNNSGGPAWVDSLDNPFSESRGYQVGGEVEAWCGPCDGMRAHTIVALVNNQPKQVICLSCNAKHNYRLTPVRARKAEDEAASRPTTVQKDRQKAQARKAEETRLALQRELAEAVQVRAFEPRQRYKAGEIIAHSEFGRGKVETVLRGSILVRFRSGLKSLSTL